MAGQVIMQSFVGFTVPMWVRRVVTMVPAIAVIALGLNVTQTLVMSQVVLSFVLPIPVIALVFFTASGKTMGAMVNAPWVSLLAAAGGVAILALNAILLWITLVPG
jgi:manganese transport protein